MELRNEEIRVFDFSTKERREYAPQVVEGENSRTIEGYAIVFNSESRVLYDVKAKRYFIETIRPEAATPAFLAEQDIKFLYNHDVNRLLGRSFLGYGTLSYEVDTYGVKFRLELPKTELGDEVLELIRRGDLFGCSFAFTYGQRGYKDSVVDGIVHREVKAFGRVNDFSVVVDPAYYATYVGTRSLPEEEEAQEEAENEPQEGTDESREKDNKKSWSAALEAELQRINDLKIY